MARLSVTLKICSIQQHDREWIYAQDIACCTACQATATSNIQELASAFWCLCTLAVPSKSSISHQTISFATSTTRFLFWFGEHSLGRSAVHKLEYYLLIQAFFQGLHVYCWGFALIQYLHFRNRSTNAFTAAGGMHTWHVVTTLTQRYLCLGILPHACLPVQRTGTD